ncbi:aminotransferase class I/II-fold pyridoxal phosphate-dependent enzyme [Rhodococcus sp. APC 3903]|uniref:aminotransferase class I/II-fold pyridoxal phosphate-dependent enzyme n=1 Tax=Rhodococcus sp. APC 3903 TaxID=3035193 RepID=UPI0025B45D40|nr:aminotransferase class I/II-fold pyridoxal phosphate-dependent enzyme [Rhodococcus sp. APC 3903]MDN3460850.1 aminotransferase class I/II-fold pyridoxal phosphate-dependent enzyme [Rhodococcus sp. APC 3903]
MQNRHWNPLEQLSLDQLRRRTSQKWSAHSSDVLSLWVAEMDVPLAPAVTNALHHAVDIGDTGYASRHGYAEAVAGFASTRWDSPDLPITHTRVLPDVMAGIIEVLRASTEPGDSVIVTTPVYAPFFSYISHADRMIVEAPLTPTGRLDINSIGNTIARVQASGRWCVVQLCTPHNPTGTVHTRSELESLARVARDAGIRVLSDEIHGPLVLPGAPFIPYFTVANSENAIASTSASKG